MANRWEVMSEYCREQHPLLCEEASEEEIYSPRYYRRIRPINYRDRARNNLKGAAAILTRWPDHWSSFLTYWWIAIGMISLTTFVIYNSLFAISMLPSVNTKPATPFTVATENKGINSETTNKSSILPDIYMHVFIGQDEEIDLNLYVPFIEIVSNTFMEYKFNLLVVINDTNVGWMSAVENNELALDMLWSKEKIVFEKDNRNHNVNIKHITLSAYMDNSPLRKYWRTLPPQLIEFLARTISVWDKGGVAFNPDILTSKFQHTLYIEKLQKILNKYAHTHKVINQSKLVSKLKKAQKKNRKLNNIRDIIDALENEDVSTNAFSQHTLTEAENRDIQLIRHARQLPENLTKNITVPNSEVNINNASNAKKIVDQYNSVSTTESTYSMYVSSNSTKMSLLPLFLEFLFHNKADVPPTSSTETTQINKIRKNVTVAVSTEKYNSLSKKKNKQIEKEIEYEYKPLIVSATGINIKQTSDNFIDLAPSMEAEESSETNRLTIDLKGNIIATNTPCHAFLGTIYSNVLHHSREETITDFIIAELTIFCKGLLSSCMGIDLILL